jgi:hypothetical protein
MTAATEITNSADGKTSILRSDQPLRAVREDNGVISACRDLPSERRGSGFARLLACLAGRALATLSLLVRHEQSTGLFVSGLGPA